MSKRLLGMHQEAVMRQSPRDRDSKASIENQLQSTFKSVNNFELPQVKPVSTKQAMRDKSHALIRNSSPKRRDGQYTAQRTFRQVTNAFKDKKQADETTASDYAHTIKNDGRLKKRVGSEDANSLSTKSPYAASAINSTAKKSGAANTSNGGAFFSLKEEVTGDRNKKNTFTMRSQSNQRPTIRDALLSKTQKE